MKHKIPIRETARRDLLNATSYLAENASEHVAAVWYQGVLEEISSLQEMPDRCSPAREAFAFKEVVVRQHFYKSHRIIFVVLQNEVHILHVWHVAQTSLKRLHLNE